MLKGEYEQSYEQLWSEVLPQTLGGIEVWSLKSEPEPDSSVDVTRFEVIFKRGGRSVVYRAYGADALKPETTMRKLFDFFTSMAAGFSAAQSMGE